MTSIQIERLINEISKLPGLGRKSAQRIESIFKKEEIIYFLPFRFILISDKSTKFFL